MNKESIKPDVTTIIEISKGILREFACYGNRYYNEHKEDKLLDRINNDYAEYEHLYREVIAQLLGVKVTGRVYTIKFVTPFVNDLEQWLKVRSVQGMDGYTYCRKYKAYILEATNRLIDTLMLHLMFDNKEVE